MNNKPCVLIVDDEETLCDVMALYFEMEGFKVIKAYNGFEGIEMLKNNPEIKVVISDVRMPEGDGVFLLKYIKEKCPLDMKTIMLSGFTGNLEEELIEMGALALFPKPTEPRALIEFVKSKLDLK
jgi:two-component system response regulator HydG